MPTYDCQCGCGEGQIHSRWFPIATGVPDHCTDCGHLMVQVISPPVVRSLEGRKLIKTESALSADRDAYRRLRDNGLQPEHVSGSALLEGHADTQFEVETGYLFPDKQSKVQVGEARKRADEYQQAASQ